MRPLTQPPARSSTGTSQSRTAVLFAFRIVSWPLLDSREFPLREAQRPALVHRRTPDFSLRKDGAKNSMQSVQPPLSRGKMTRTFPAAFAVLLTIWANSALAAPITVPPPDLGPQLAASLRSILLFSLPQPLFEDTSHWGGQKAVIRPLRLEAE